MTSQPIGDRLARPDLRSLPRADLAGAPIPGTIRLDANENPYPPLAGGKDINRYPEPQPDVLRRRMAGLYGVFPQRLWVTRGSDDAIDLLCRAFLRPGQDRILVVEPTFSAYAQFARIQGAKVDGVSMGEDFVFDAGTVLKAAKHGPAPKLLFLCTPNNPTGTAIDVDRVRDIARALPDTLVVADEAYGEFADAPSLAPDAGNIDNLVVLRTLSKAYGLAGARIGCAIADANVIDWLARVSPPYPLPGPSIAAALSALAPERMPIHAERVETLLAERKRLAGLLREVDEVEALHEGGNYLFLVVADPEGLARRLEAAAVRVRFRPNAAPGGVRVTIGTEAENRALLAVFGIVDPAPERRRASVTRDTAETQIALSIDLDAPEPRRQISTGIGFFDHMLDQVASHGGFSLTLACTGDTHIDPHHTIEDVALALGTALDRALGDRAGIGRFGFALPMDETRAEVLVDLSGRPFARFDGSFEAEHLGEFPTEMTPHVFRSLADSMRAAIHVRVEGDNDHHKVEGAFKAFGRALRQGLATGGGGGIPSTKGSL
ncbi:histidinol-phosphate transaminase [Sphingomicrobium astaxanthinifaciens]|uniref:histidinol-phosphate transaminase n=1 Tax=Sphingomicrobium astaxanthinifaciens TaxID=1227949 RepID=UPI001FCA6EA7|nr:histidinol-phosphate transaminase [Sphingomicrobium astaxanthinifaciens]MCJ7421208.1 histidinol-phosphate transaminase [Sphingomicrobium astaxanthinifaciens]